MLKTRVLLIVSPFHFFDSCVHRTEVLGVEYLAASLRSAGYEVGIMDPTFNSTLDDNNGLYYYGLPDDIMTERIKSFSPDVVGISCHYSFSAEGAYNVAKIAKDIDSRITTIIGGLFVSLYSQQSIAECDFLDYGIAGEAEHTFLELLNQLGSPLPKFEQIDGLVYRENGSVKYNPKSDFIEDLDTLPFPARDMLDITEYMKGSFEKRLYGLGFRPSLSILTSRSCPHRCAYCNMYRVHGPRWRPRSVDNVIGEIEEITGRYKAEHVFIMDDNFSFNTDRAKQICEKIIQKNIRFRWNTPNGISVKGVDHELAELMKKSGCANVCIAIESGSEDFRKRVMNKKVSNSDITNAVECFGSVDIPMVGFLLIGMPGESKQCFEESRKFVSSLPLSSIVVSFAVPFYGTKLYEDLVMSGVISEQFNFEMDDYNRPSFQTPDFTAEELIERKQILRGMFAGLDILYQIESRRGNVA